MDDIGGRGWLIRYGADMHVGGPANRPRSGRPLTLKSGKMFTACCK
jgi:hypothetical protein